MKTYIIVHFVLCCIGLLGNIVLAAVDEWEAKNFFSFVVQAGFIVWAVHLLWGQ